MLSELTPSTKEVRLEILINKLVEELSLNALIKLITKGYFTEDVLRSHLETKNSFSYEEQITSLKVQTGRSLFETLIEWKTGVCFNRPLSERVKILSNPPEFYQDKHKRDMWNLIVSYINDNSDVFPLSDLRVYAKNNKISLNCYFESVLQDLLKLLYAREKEFLESCTKNVTLDNIDSISSQFIGGHIHFQQSSLSKKRRNPSKEMFADISNPESMLGSIDSYTTAFLSPLSKESIKDWAVSLSSYPNTFPTEVVQFLLYLRMDMILDLTRQERCELLVPISFKASYGGAAEKLVSYYLEGGSLFPSLVEDAFNITLNPETPCEQFHNMLKEFISFIYAPEFKIENDRVARSNSYMRLFNKRKPIVTNKV